MKVEHVNGLVKSRFQGMREIRLKLINPFENMKAVNFVAPGYETKNNLVDLSDGEWHYRTASDKINVSEYAVGTTENSGSKKYLEGAKYN